MGLITADVETSSTAYARRFGGPLGAWMLSVQTSLIARALASGGCERGCSLLDVGGGHDQIAAPLESLGYRVTVSSSSLTATEMIRKRRRGGVVACNLVSQPFGSRFDAVTCIRLLTHSGEGWRALVAEMCRLAERAVIIDYPPLVSFNLLYPILFSIKRRLEGDTRTFALFLHREIETEFKKAWFYVEVPFRAVFAAYGGASCAKLPGSVASAGEPGAHDWIVPAARFSCNRVFRARW